MQERLQDVAAALVTDRQASIRQQPGQGALDLPAVVAQPLAGLHPTAGDPGGDASPPQLYAFDAAKLSGYVGACATRLRLPRTALPALTEALDGLGPARTKQRALVLADLAVNHRALGYNDQARELAAEAHAIGIERRSAKVLQRVRLAA